MKNIIKLLVVWFSGLFSRSKLEEDVNPSKVKTQAERRREAREIKKKDALRKRVVYGARLQGGKPKYARHPQNYPKRMGLTKGGKVKILLRNTIVFVNPGGRLDVLASLNNGR